MAEPGDAKYYLVEAAALPKIYIQVTKARELLDTGLAQTVTEATERVGISRSVYYKYRDAVVPFRDMGRGRIVTFQLLLRDHLGVLSSVLSLFSKTGANILTVNQSIPTHGAAPVTITADTADMDVSMEELLALVSGAEGMIKAAVVAG